MSYPVRMGEAFLLLGDDLSGYHLREGVSLMKLGIKPDSYDYHGVATGQNLVWLAYVHIMTGLLEKATWRSEGLLMPFIARSKYFILMESRWILVFTSMVRCYIREGMGWVLPGISAA